MLELEKLIRPGLVNLKPYSSARDEFKGTEGVFLDANENPFGTLNRYPDPLQIEVKERLSFLKGLPPSNIFLGNGSDEAIDLIFRLFCIPGKDRALTFSPSYGMYDVSAEINDVELIKIPLNNSFQIDWDLIEKHINNPQLKLIFICSPNNPTGNSIEGIERILNDFNGIVIVDEAYIDFSPRPSFTTLLKDYKNLIVLQTLSKAWGLAGARVGMAYSSSTIISYLNKIKPPYNVSGLNQQAGLNALNEVAKFEENKSTILEQKKWLEEKLNSISCITKVYPSDANFILIETTDANFIYNSLVEKSVITRNRNSVLKNCIRITVGSAEENQQLINALSAIEA